MQKFTIEDHAAQIDLLGSPGVPDGYTVKLTADKAGLSIEVERPHGEESSTWDVFEFAVPIEAEDAPPTLHPHATGNA